jgi:1-acyl-sn-glycerol-3-phosphate acyltransferase
MKLREAYRATIHWIPFVARTIGYGTISLVVGPLTREHRASLWAMRGWCKASVKGLGIEVTASGIENVPQGEPFIYCSNHQSLVDILVLGSVLPGDYKWAAKRSLMKIPFVGWHLRLSGHVPVDRGAGSGAAAAVVERFQEVLGRGKLLLIFPEGTRSEDGIVRGFKVGAFSAAVRQGVPIVPIAIEGTHRLLKKGAVDLGHGVVRHVAVRIGAPLWPAARGDEVERIDELRSRTRATILELHRSIGGTVPEQTGSDDAESEAQRRGHVRAARRLAR